MKNFFLWFAKPPVLSLIGVLLLSLLMWFGGPQLALGGWPPFESENVRWVFIWLFFLCWAGWFAGKLLLAQIKNAQFMRKAIADEQAKATPESERTTREEAAELSDRMRRAMDILKKKRRSGPGGGQYMYQLPWYMFVGAPGTGKTTALEHADLQFPLAGALGAKPIAGVGGTRRCDWWFTDEAVLLDTAGRYTTQDSHEEVDKAAWNGFLDLLKRYRRRRPLNGVIVALSVSDLLGKEEILHRQAQAVRARVKELNERLGLRFPVYVMVTKCDLLAGFAEFFGNMGKEEIAQVWGMTFPLAVSGKLDGVGGVGGVDGALASFWPELKLLEAQLQARVLARMQAERDVQRRALQYSFPQQFAGIGERLEQFLRAAFQSNTYDEQALLRGVYFTSGTQEGSPIDRVMGALAASFGLERQALPFNSGKGRSFFLTRLLKEVVFKEAELVGLNQRFERQRRWLQWGALAGLALLLLLVGAALLTSYHRNQAFLEEFAQASDAVQKLAQAAPPDGSAVAVLPLLEAARAFPGGFAECGRNPPPLSRFWQSLHGELGGRACQTYRRLLRETLRPRISADIEAQLRRGSTGGLDALYETLRVYLLLGMPRTDADSEAVRTWLDKNWIRKLPYVDETARQALLGHLAVLLKDDGDGKSGFVPDAVLVAEVREALSKMRRADRIYARLKNDFLTSDIDLPEFTLSKDAGVNAAQVFTRVNGQSLAQGVPGLYSVAGYRKFAAASVQALSDESKDAWVLEKRETKATPDDLNRMRTELMDAYYQDYTTQWENFLDSVRIQPIVSLGNGVVIVTNLAGADSPLKKLLQGAARETKLDGTLLAAQATDSAMKAVTNKAGELVRGLGIGAQLDAGQLAGPKKPILVDAKFEWLHQLVGMVPPAVPGGPATFGGQSELDGIIQLLKEVVPHLQAVENAKKTQQPIPRTDVLDKLTAASVGKRPPLRDILETIGGGTASQAAGGERARIVSQWAGSPAGQTCGLAIAGRYPVVRRARDLIPPDDFAKFFAPGGLMDDFFDKNLKDHVNMGKSWTWQQAGNVPLGLPGDVLVSFQQARRIRDAFFSLGGRQASLRFELKVVSVDPGVQKLDLELDGQHLTYGGNGQVGGPFQLTGNRLARLDLTPAGPRGGLRVDGDWAWLRLIDQGVLEPIGNSERFKLSFDVDGRKVVFELKAPSVIDNPFRRELLENFRCPELR